MTYAVPAPINFIHRHFVPSTQQFHKDYVFKCLVDISLIIAVDGFAKAVVSQVDLLLKA